MAALEPEEFREALSLRDHCGADWELVRARFGLLSVEAAISTAQLRATHTQGHAAGRG